MLEYPKLLQTLAEQGDINAQYNLALLHLHGKGVEQNTHHAIRWLNQAAELGSVDAQLLLGFLYAEQQEIVLAFRWLEAAAEQDCATAQYCLGLMYREGKGTDKNPPKAREWLQKAAKQGHHEAKQALGEV